MSLFNMNASSSPAVLLQVKLPMEDNKTMEDNIFLVPATHIGDPDIVPGFWLQCISALSIKATEPVDQDLELPYK